ncbi:MAG: NUDIX domain-containing protein [Candidatus Saccharimonadales bacterium]
MSRMTMNYCYLCGHTANAVVTHEGTHWKCTSCAQTYFANPKPATEIILIDELGRAAVAVRARDPYKGKLDLPGGFVDAGETLEEGIAREIFEEVGLTPEQYSKPVYLESATADYPWGHELTQVVTAAYTAQITSTVQLTASDDVASIEFLTADQLKRDDFAWPTQYDRIEQAIEHWRKLIRT